MWILNHSDISTKIDKSKKIYFIKCWWHGCGGNVEEKYTADRNAKIYSAHGKLVVKYILAIWFSSPILGICPR